MNRKNYPGSEPNPLLGYTCAVVNGIMKIVGRFVSLLKPVVLAHSVLHVDRPFKEGSVSVSSMIYLVVVNLKAT